MSELIECIDGLTANQIFRRAAKSGNPFYLQTKGLSSVPAILSDGNTVGWYIADELSTLTLDVFDRPTEWRDFLGSGHDLTAAVGPAQPLWSANGVLFDGVGNWMQTANFTWNKPCMIYAVMKQVTWTVSDYMFYANSGGSYFQQRTSTPNVRIVNTTASALNGNMAVDTWVIVRLVFDDNNRLQINETAPTLYASAGVNWGGFTLGASNLGAQASNIQVREIILRDITDTAPNEAEIYAYLKDKYSL